MVRRRCLVVADDLTGGGDTGAQFARWGLRTLLVLAPAVPFPFERYEDQDALVLNTQSRGLGRAEAADAVFRLVRDVVPGTFPVVYKKIDSTMRGNIGAEVEALLRAMALPAGFLTPAYPELGRTVAGGILFVHGKPVASTEASRDPVSPVTESEVARIVETQTSVPVRKVTLPQGKAQAGVAEQVRTALTEGAGILVFDAVDRPDLSAVAEAGFAMDPIPLFAGSAGLAEEVAGRLAGGAGAGTLLREIFPEPFRHILVVSGSASRVTRSQLDRLKSTRGGASFELGLPTVLAGAGKRRDGEALLGGQVARSLGEGMVILSVSPGRPSKDVERERQVPREITLSLGRIVARGLNDAGIDRTKLALFLTGGDTAMGVIDLLGADGVEVGGEVIEGIMGGRLRGGAWDGLRVVTKAGGFGKEDALERVVQFLENKR
jgi:D-threonate/D-erythronate kinase